MGNPIIDNAAALLKKINVWGKTQVFGSGVSTEANAIFLDQNGLDSKAFGIRNVDALVSFGFYNPTTYAFETTEFTMGRLSGLYASGLAVAGSGAFNGNGYKEKNYTLSPCTVHACVTTGTGTPVINGSNNVTSITDNGAGDYTVNFTTALANANYAANVTLMPNTGEGTNMDAIVMYGTAGTSSIRILVGNASNVRADQEKFYLSIFGATA